MRTCGLWQFKLRTCDCGLLLILVHNFASFIQILKFLSIFVKYLCFYPVKHEKSIQFFWVQVRQKYQVFPVQADKNTKFAFRLNRFLFVDMLFFRVWRNNRLFLSLISIWQPCSKYGFVVFYREFTKLVTVVSFFVLVANAVSAVGPRCAVPPLTTACAPPFWFTQNAFLEHHVTTRQQVIMEKGMIIFKHNFRLKFSRLFAKLLATNCFI